MITSKKDFKNFFKKTKKFKGTYFIFTTAEHLGLNIDVKIRSLDEIDVLDHGLIRKIDIEDATLSHTYVPFSAIKFIKFNLDD